MTNVHFRCSYCEKPILPGEAALMISAHRVDIGPKSGQILLFDDSLEDGDEEKLFHTSCLAPSLPYWATGRTLV